VGKMIVAILVYSSSDGRNEGFRLKLRELGRSTAPNYLHSASSRFLLLDSTSTGVLKHSIHETESRMSEYRYSVFLLVPPPGEMIRLNIEQEASSSDKLHIYQFSTRGNQFLLLRR